MQDGPKVTVFGDYYNNSNKVEDNGKIFSLSREKLSDDGKTIVSTLNKLVENEVNQYEEKIEGLIEMLNGCKSSLSEAETKYLNSNCNDKNFENEVFNYKAEIESLNEKIECEKSKVVDLKSLSKTVEDSINELLNKVKSLFEKVVNLECNLDKEKEYLKTQLSKTLEEKSKLEERVKSLETLLKQSSNQHKDKSDLRFKNNTSLNESYKRLNDELKFKFKTDKVLKILSSSLQNLTKAEDDLTETNNVQQLVGHIERATSNDNLNKKVTDLKTINKINNLKNVAVDFEDNLLNSNESKVFKADRKAKEILKFNESTKKRYSANNLNLEKAKNVFINKNVEIDTNLQEKADKTNENVEISFDSTNVLKLGVSNNNDLNRTKESDSKIPSKKEFEVNSIIFRKILHENSEDSNKNLEYKNEINKKEPTKNLEIVLTEDIVLNTSTVYDTIKKDKNKVQKEAEPLKSSKPQNVLENESVTKASVSGASARKLFLKILIQQKNSVQKVIQLNSSFKIQQACVEIRKKFIEAQRGNAKDYGLLFRGNDLKKKNAIWLHPQKTFEHYLLRNGDVLEYKLKLRPLKIMTVDQQYKTHIVDDSDSVSKMMFTICLKLGIINHEEYSLARYSINDFVENITSQNKYKKPNATPKALRKITTTDYDYQWLSHGQTLSEQGVGESEVLILRRKYFYSDRNISSRDPVQLNLLYQQSREAILKGKWLASKKEAVFLAAYQLQIQLGKYDEKKFKTRNINFNEFLPIEYSNQRTMNKKIVECYSNLGSITDVEAKVNYTRQCRNLPTYGATFFLVWEIVKGHNRLAPKLLGITKEAIIRVDKKTKQVLRKWYLYSVMRWGVSSNTLTLDFGDYKDGYYSVQTTEGNHIAQLISGYIDIIVKNRRITDNYDYDIDREGVMEGFTLERRKAKVFNAKEAFYTY